MNRKERALIALHDYGTRTGATAKSVMAAMKKDGFTEAEVKAAAKDMSK